MMKKTYLMKGFAAFSLGLLAASCSNTDFSTVNTVSEEDAVVNAELSLGVDIDPNQTWVMTQEVSAAVTVNGDYGVEYEVTIYQNNPFASDAAVVLGKGKTVSGSTATFDFTAPKGTYSAFAAIKDANGYSYVKPVAISEGKIVTTFGGEAAAGARAARAARRSAADDFTIATRTMPDLSAYIDDAVAITAENNVTYGGGVEHYLIPEGTEWSANIPLIQSGSGISVYVQGTLNINAEQRVNGGCVFIVGPKGTVNIASGQQLVTNANNEAGTVGSFYVYPGGKVQGEGTLQFANGSGSYNYNGGTIDVGTINNNGGTLYNAGTLEADIMEGGAGLSIYENAGKVHIGKCVKGSSSANIRIYNNCWWECDGDIYCRNIQQGVGAYIKGANLGMVSSYDGTNDASYIWAKENSLIDIPGYVAFSNVDIIGPTGDGYAYLQFGEATGVDRTGDLGWGSNKLGINMNYGTSWGSIDGAWKEYMSAGAIQNNIRMSVDRPFTQSNIYTESAYEKLLNMMNGTKSYSIGQADPSWGWSELPVQGNGNALMVAKGQVTDVVTEDDCSPGVVIVPPTPVVETYPVYSYAFEDTKLGDYDMNDVVLKVQEFVDGEGDDATHKLAIRLVASGATLDLNLRLYAAAEPEEGEAAHYGSEYTELTYNGENEVHAMLGVRSGTMVNTNAGAKAQPITIVIDKGSYNPAALPLAIYSVAQGEMRLAGSGKAPYGVVVPWDWKWPVERENISTKAYKNTNTDEGDQSFAKFASTYGAALNWFKYPTGSVMNEASLGF